MAMGDIAARIAAFFIALLIMLLAIWGCLAVMEQIARFFM